MFSKGTSASIFCARHTPLGCVALGACMSQRRASESLLPKLKRMRVWPQEEEKYSCTTALQL